MIAKLEFDLPEDQDDFKFAIHGRDFYSVLWELDLFLRSEIKYQNKDYQTIRDKLNELMNDNNLTFDMVS